MPRRQLAGLILASALITLDGTATTIALPAIGRDLSSSVFRLQWISSAPLVILAALLLPAGAVADRFGRERVTRAGLIIFVLGAIGCLLAPSDLALVGGRSVQGAGGALILPAVLAILRGSYTDAVERARIFGAWAAWTGVASAAGPLMAGALIDIVSWRAVFVPSVVAGLVAVLLVRRDAAGSTAPRNDPLPLAATVAMVMLFGATAYLLTVWAGGDATGWQVGLPLVLAAVAAVRLTRGRQLDVLFPRELFHAHNCLPANTATFALYFGMFGLSFLVALYTQQVLGYSALEAALMLLPVSIMLLLAEVFGRLAARVGTRVLITGGALSAAAGIYWIAAGPDPPPFWSHQIAGTSLFGLGISLAVSALTHAAVAAVPDTCAGAASGLNHAVARAAGLVAIALLGSVAAPGLSDAVSTEGFERAMIICAAVVGVGGVLGSVLLKDEEPGGLSKAA
jgi:MFS family permease